MTQRPRVLVLGASAADAPPGIEAAGDLAEVRLADTPEAAAAEIAAAEAMFAWHGRRDLLEPVWGAAGRLGWIQTSMAGVDAFLFPALVESDVVVTNAGGVFDAAIAEWVIGMVVLFAKNGLAVLERQRRHEWLHELTEPVAGKRLLVVGVGGIGRAVARRALALGLDVRGLGRRPRTGDELFDAVLGPGDLLDALGWADYVIDVLPGTEATRHAFGAREFAAMRAGARFVNVGRGSSVDEAALVDALRSGHLAGAALDVFEREPLPADSALWDLPNVVVYPHMSGDYAGWHEVVVDLFLDNLGRFVRGEPLRNVVDKRLGYPAGP